MPPREQGKTGLLIVVLGPRSCEGCETDGGSLAMRDYGATDFTEEENNYCDVSAA